MESSLATSTSTIQHRSRHICPGDWQNVLEMPFGTQLVKQNNSKTPTGLIDREVSIYFAWRMLDLADLRCRGVLDFDDGQSRVRKM